MKFSTVQIKYKYIYAILAFLFFGLFYTTIFFDFEYRIIISLILLFLMFFFFIFAYKSYKVKRTGIIEFKDDFILIYDINNQLLNKLTLKSVDEIILKYSAFKGELPVNGSITVIK